MLLRTLMASVRGKPNVEVVVYPGVTHAFIYPQMGQFGFDYLGHHMVYDEKATQDAERRADAFMDAHMSPK
jgi:dienelactone hydrolase